MNADFGLAVLRATGTREQQRSDRSGTQRRHEQLVVAGPIDDTAAQRDALVDAVLEADIPGPAAWRVQVARCPVDESHGSPDQRRPVSSEARIDRALELLERAHG